MTSTKLTIMAPVDGVIVPLNEVPDPVFAEGTLGDGLALDPLGDTLTAPCDGEVVQCARTAHAVTIRSEAGVEVLVHLGLDTVDLDGAGIELCVTAGQRVSTGQPLLRFDPDCLAQGAMSLITPIIITDDAGWRIVERFSDRAGRQARQGQPLLLLAADGGAERPIEATAEGPLLDTDVILALSAGLHARPAARLRAIAHEYRVDLKVECRGERADTSSLSGLLNLGLVKGSQLTLTARGEQAQAALDAAVTLLSTADKDEHRSDATQATGAVEPGQLAGLVASSGLAIGPLVRYAPPLPQVPFEGDGVEQEARQLSDALSRVSDDIQRSMAQAERAGRTAEVEIFAAHLAWLEDPALQQAAVVAINAGCSAGQAWREALDGECERLKATGNPLLAARAIDLRDLQRQVMAQFGDTPAAIEVPEGAILIADDLTPSELIAVARAHPAGLCLAAGGTTSHVAILARARGLPCLVAMGEALYDADGEQAILDAERGVLEPMPDAARLQLVQSRLKERRQIAVAEQEMAQAPALTHDGTRIEVCANIASPAEAGLAAAAGADGVGLMRSEFLFFERDDAPDEACQRDEYQATVDALGGMPVVVRTLDIGADKQLPYLALPGVANPALGIRGVRL